MWMLGSHKSPPDPKGYVLEKEKSSVLYMLPYNDETKAE